MQSHKLDPLIHVGYPKAASSWLQSHFFVPGNGFFQVLDPVTLQLLLIDPTPFSYTPEKAREWIQSQLDAIPGSGDLIPVISAESLVGHAHCGGYNARLNADRLFELSPGGKILIVVREQLSEIRSLYKTFINWGMPHSIERILNPVEPRLSPQFNLDFLRYDLLVGNYQQLYGKENVLVLPYEQFVRRPRLFLKKIYQFSGREGYEQQLKQLPIRSYVNKNQTMLNLKIQRWKNYFFLSGPFNYSGMFVAGERGHNKRMAGGKKNLFPPFMDNWFEKGFTDFTTRHCAGQFVESNRRLNQLTGLKLAQYGYQI